MIIDGKKFAEEIKTSLASEVLKLGKKPRLAVVKVAVPSEVSAKEGGDKVTEKFLEQKKKFGSAVGIDVRVYDLPADITTNKLREKLAEIIHIKENTGVIVQLPLPNHINTQYILDGIIPEQDPDLLSSKSLGLFASGRSRILPPVVAAIDYIFKTYGIELKAKKVVLVGAGKLVGKPVAIWLINEGATVTIINEFTKNYKLFTINSDIIISGVGKPNLITADAVKDGVVVIDCGTAQEQQPATSNQPEAGSRKQAAKLVGDIDPAVAKKASLFAPVPGGVGPLTVAMLFKNLVELAKK